jgi:SAM-dependent methyltransferase
LDAFCGCGTALAVAKRLKRQYIGIDISPTACRLVAWRLNGYDKTKDKVWNENAYKEFNAAPFVEGLALTPTEIAGLSGFEFQNWINRELGANPGKAGADGGIDGILDGIPIQVKKYKAGRNDLDSFIGTLVRKNSKEGIFIALDFPTTIPQEVRRLERENGYKIMAWTFQDVLNGKAKEWRRMRELL